MMKRNQTPRTLKTLKTLKSLNTQISTLLLTLFFSCIAAGASAQSRKGYALWCLDAKTMYFIQADNQPTTYHNYTVTSAWEINDKNLRNGTAAPAWIVPQTVSGQTTLPQELTTVVIEPNFRFVTPSGCYSWFHGCTKLKTVTGLVYLNTSRAGYMNKMFYGCTELESIDFTGVDMEPVINTTMMFYGCSKLKTIHADGAWTNPYSAYMFTGCEQLEGYDPQKVDGTMANGENGYFNSDSHIYALCLDGVGSANDYLYFIRTSENIAINDEYDGKLVNTVYGYDDFKEVNPDGSWTWAWNGNTWIRHVVFEPSFRNVHLPTLEGFLKGYTNGSIIDVDGLEYLNTSEVTSMRSMFEGCVDLTSLDVSSLDMSGVQDIGRMFKGCSNITSINLSGVNTSNVTDMEYLFAGCSKLQSLDLSSLDTRRVTRMSHLFEGCRSLNTLNVSPLNTSSVTDMEAMFAGCYFQGYYGTTGLQELDVNTFDMTNVTNTKEMFLNCSALRTIYCDNTWDVPTSDDMFKGCTSLSAHISYDPEKVDGTYANPHTGYFYSELYPPTYDPQGRFIVSNAAKWEEFANLVNSGEHSDMNAVMTKNVDLGDSQVMVGTEDHPYTGTFEGNGHTLNIAYVPTDTYCAPFPYVQGCTIQNLHVTGTINTSYKAAAGLIGRALESTTAVNITKCWSSVVINSTIEGSGHLSGFFAEHSSKTDINMTNCLFDGAIIGENTSGCGGFFGYVNTLGGSNHLGKVTILRALMNGRMQFDTTYQNREASGPFYGFYKLRATSDDYCSNMDLENYCYYTVSAPNWSTTLQGTNCSNESVETIVSWVDEEDEVNWTIIDGKPALRY